MKTIPTHSTYFQKVLMIMSTIVLTFISVYVLANNNSVDIPQEQENFGLVTETSDTMLSSYYSNGIED